ncbi:HEAT repeat protein [Streptomyces sp. V3I8]|uniref:HEAT repeat domain-containing protein n=1 Tax=Streptomyces sp. V3I8 TaxID=3042279 RepID=UPI00278B2856|nr:HEAT repeat domain-containing protein [Streptomyces sp. V3I8]MDQ1034166.1 HEAT repeat protein [Streptomyces sp. V3I8]
MYGNGAARWAGDPHVVGVQPTGASRVFLPGGAMGAEQQIAYFLRELAGADPGRRAAAAKGLGRTGGPEHAGVLVGATGDPVPGVRAGAARGLGRLGVPQAGATVLPRLMRDTDADVRRRASLAAIRLGLAGREVTEAFASLLGDPDHHVRINALAGLATLDVPGDAVALVRLLGDPRGQVWGHARMLVHRFGADPAVEAEMLRTAREGESAARARALDMLSRDRTGTLLDSLLAGLRDPSPEVRRAVAPWLLDLERPAVRDALVAALRTERDPGVADLLLGGLGWRGEHRVTGLAARWLRDPLTGRGAARTLGRLGGRAAVDLLGDVLDDSTLPAGTRAAAAEGVGEAGRWDAVWVLLPLLDDPDAAVRAGVIGGLGRLVHEGLRLWERRPVAWALTGHLASGKDAARRTTDALHGLAEALPAVRRLADTSASGEVRAAALSVLDAEDAPDRRTARQDVRRFERGLDDEHEDVRLEAVRGLARWAAQGALPPVGKAVRARLTALAGDEASSPSLRREAAELLMAPDANREE